MHSVDSVLSAMQAVILILWVTLHLATGQYYLYDQSLGCDGIIGSGKKWDRCGVCDGNDLSCRIISGIYTRNTVGAKYELITDFPVGASRINVTEARNSRNYLALRYSDSLQSIINGNWSLDWNGEYPAAGSRVIYSRSRNGELGEHMFIEGPIKQRLQLMLLVQARNPGIYYDYVIMLPPRQPQIADSLVQNAGALVQRSGSIFVGDALGGVPGDSGYRGNSLTTEPNKFQWRTVPITECTHTCGGGLRQLQAVCVLTANQVKVTEENCDVTAKPATVKISCNNQPCPADWSASNWSQCSTTCGPGTQTRFVECKRRIAESHEVRVYSAECDPRSRPSIVQACQQAECFTWHTSDWEQCSVICGAGSRSRRVICKDSIDSEVNDTFCPADKPRHKEQCYAPCDKAWFYSDWLNRCSTDCNSSISRQVYCPADENKVQESGVSACGAKPETERSCDQVVSCSAAKWFTGEWSTCTGSCTDAYQQRDVVCMQKKGHWHTVTYDKDCAAERKPETTQKCRLTECDSTVALWFVTDWGKCSVSCGKGYERREVKCLGNDLEETNSCRESSKPQSTRECWLTECPRKQAANSPRCSDQHSNCIVVVQARLCRLAYYKQLCCASCDLDL